MVAGLRVVLAAADPAAIRAIEHPLRQAVAEDAAQPNTRATRKAATIRRAISPKDTLRTGPAATDATCARRPRLTDGVSQATGQISPPSTFTNGPMHCLPSSEVHRTKRSRPGLNST
jgi:hypothetical protein